MHEKLVTLRTQQQPPQKKKQRKSVKYMIEERREKWLKRKKKKSIQTFRCFAVWLCNVPVSYQFNSAVPRNCELCIR